jgi:hypothetical protein
MRSVFSRSPHKETTIVTKTFTIALLACAISSTAIAAQQKDKDKDKSGAYTQPIDQPVVMPAAQKPEQWKFQKEKEAEAQKAVEDKKAAKKKAEEDKKAAAEARKKAAADHKLANQLAKEEAEKKRVDERRAAADQKKADEQQRAADARAEREAAAVKRAEEQKAADEKRALERRAEAERAAEEVREKEAREAEKKAAAAERSASQKSAAQKPAPASENSTPPVAVASPPPPARTPASVATVEQKAPAKSSSAPASQRSSARKPADQKAPAQKDGAQKGAAPATESPAAAGQSTAGGDKPVVDPMRPPAVIRAGEQPDAWKMQSEKPRTEGAAGQGQTQRANASEGQATGGKTGQGKPAASTPPKPKEPWRGWSDRALISLNMGWQSSSFDLRDTRNFESQFVGDREQRTLAADYSVQSGMSLDFGGGYRVWRALAAGVSVTRFKDSRDVPVNGSVPHPFFFNRARSVSGVTSGARQEMAVHVDAMWVMPVRPKMTLALFGGPSFYKVKQTVVSDYDYNQSYPYDDVTLTRVIAGDESSSVTGVNFGADVGYYFTETIGVGGLIRFGRASVDTSIGSIDVGGPEFGVGVRIRIPQARTRPRASTPQPPPSTPR